jgi:hypothetical protein
MKQWKNPCVSPFFYAKKRAEWRVLREADREKAGLSFII